MIGKVPLALVPGAGCTARLWREQIEALGDVADPIVVDNARHGTVGALVSAALDGLPGRFALAGLSQGGLIALEIVRQAPERVLKLALLDTQASPEAPEAAVRRSGIAERLRSGELSVGDVQAMLWPRLVHERRRADKELEAVVLGMARETGPEGLANQQEIFTSVPDYRPSLGAIRAPTLVIVGEGDTLTPPVESERMALDIPGARLVRIPDCGHLSTLEAPAAVSAAMREWLICV